MSKAFRMDGDYVEVFNQSTPGPWQGLKFGTPSDFAIFYDDFVTYTAADWTITTVGAASATTLGGSAMGHLLLTNDAADNDYTSMQLLGSAWQAETGKRKIFETVVSITDATQADMLVGFMQTNINPLVIGATSGVYFKKDDGDTQLDIEVYSAGVLIAAVYNIATMTTSDMKLALVAIGTGSLDYYVNDVKLGTITAGLPSSSMRLTYHVQNGEAVIKRMTVRYVQIALER